MASYLKLFVDCLEKYQKLSDSEFGRLVRAALQYKATGAEPTDLGLEELLWDGIKLDIDRDTEKYANVVAARSEAGKKGGRPKKQKKQMLFWESKKSQDKDKEEDKDKDKEEDKDNPPPKSPQGERFERFWACYPRKVGKGNARKIFAKLKPSEEMLGRMIRAVELAKQSPQWQRDGGQYIPHPATWLNQERWEDEEPEAEPDRPPVAMNWVVPNPDSDNWEDLVP